MMVDEYLPGIMAVIDGGVEAVDAKSPSSYCAIAHFARIVEWRGNRSIIGRTLSDFT
jgi:hypothetical protein